MLPNGQQERLYKFCQANTVIKAAEWCEETLKVVTSKSAVGRFLKWYESQKWVDDVKQLADEFRENLRLRPGFKEDGRAVMDAAQVFFETQVMKTRDAKLFVSLKKVQNKEQTLRLDREKFEFDAAKACLNALPALKAIASDKSLDENAKLTAVREKLFGEVPE